MEMLKLKSYCLKDLPFDRLVFQVNNDKNTSMCQKTRYAVKQLQNVIWHSSTLAPPKKYMFNAIEVIWIDIFCTPI